MTFTPTPSSARTSQSFHEPEQKCPQGGILLSMLKSLERELIKRNILAASGTPLWFLAEMERNIFLWRKGYSLADQTQFEFWVDPVKLIEKRLQRLERGANSESLGMIIGEAEPVSPQAERRYLEELATRLNSVAVHAEALSHVSSLVLEEVKQPRHRIVLPYKSETVK